MNKNYLPKLRPRAIFRPEDKRVKSSHFLIQIMDINEACTLVNLGQRSETMKSHCITKMGSSITVAQDYRNGSFVNIIILLRKPMNDKKVVKDVNDLKKLPECLVHFVL